MDGIVVRVAKRNKVLRPLGWMILNETPEHRGKGPVEPLGLPVGARNLRRFERFLYGENLTELLDNE